jgi:methionyl-tRNA synthetase
LPKDVPGNVCPDHSPPLREVSESNWFFAFSKFRYELLKVYHSISPILIEPETKHNEVLSFLETNELQDISISRGNDGWGVPIPWDKTQVVYVWIDALLNYLTGVGFGTDLLKFNHHYPADIHFIGKDITRFHCLIFPAMIMAYNYKTKEQLREKPPETELGKLIQKYKEKEDTIPLPKKIFAHGFITNRGDKIAKSGKFIDPMEIVNKYGVDAYRYYFLAKCDYAKDGEYDPKHFHEVYNADLANNLGNLVSRVVSMALNYFDGTLEGKVEFIKTRPDSSYIEEFKKHMDVCEYKIILDNLWEDFRILNRIVETERPWDLIKGDKDKCCIFLKTIVQQIRKAMIYLKPFFPEMAAKVYNSFTFKTPWEKISLDAIEGDQVEYPVSVNRAMLIDGKYPPLFVRK